MLNILIIILAAILLPGLLFYENKESRKGIVPTKTVLSLLFLFAVLIQPHPISRYYQFLLIGLVWCLCGDICLALPQKKMLLIALFFFLFGHLSYIFGFFSAAQIGLLTWVGSLAVMSISAWIYTWLRPHLGAMEVPVLLYIVIITVMISGAWTVLGDINLTRSGRIMVLAGAFSFYFSDVFVARDRFVKKEFLNRLIGLPLYYFGQFLLAFSVGLLRQSSPG
jgi:uncharacterized membrane protein YhhN